MTSYFEKLTSINTSSLSLVSGKFQSSTTPQDLTSALEKLEDLKTKNTKLEVDLKCEQDEKNELVGLKVGLESEILELREVNERLEFQVQQLKEEKDNIHHVLANVRETEIQNGMFIATSGFGSGVVKKFPTMDDISDPANLPQQHPALERIEEIDETLLESLRTEPVTQKQTLETLTKRVAYLESENQFLRSTQCPRCRRQEPQAQIFEQEDEGLVLSAVDEEDPQDETQINAIVEMQRKIIEKLEREVYRIDGGRGVTNEVISMKLELEKRLHGIVKRVQGDGTANH